MSHKQYIVAINTDLKIKPAIRTFNKDYHTDLVFLANNQLKAMGSIFHIYDSYDQKGKAYRRERRLSEVIQLDYCFSDWDWHNIKRCYTICIVR